MAFGAPVFQPFVMHVDSATFGWASELSHFRFGFCYATERRTDVGDRLTFEHAAESNNRIRFVLLALLYGWYHVCSDQQVVYRIAPPYEVFSIDHEQSIVRSGEWQVSDLPTMPVPEPSQWVVSGATLSQAELNASKATLEALTPESIASAVAAPHESWEITLDERIALADLLWNRKDGLVACLN